MSIILYWLYVAFTYLRPFETFLQEYQDYRPMVVLSGFAVAAAVVAAVMRGRVNVRPVYFCMLAGLLACIALSKITTGWLGGAVPALGDFSSSALLFVLTALAISSVAQLRSTLALLVIVTLILSLAGIAAYHTGFMADRLVLRQSIGDGDEPSEDAEAIIPASDTSGQYLWRVRSVGFLNDPNDFAQIIVVAMPLLGIWYRKGRSLRNLILVGLPAAAFVYAIFLTHSRGAFIGMASLMFFGLRRRLGMTRTAVLIGLLLTGLVVTNAAGGRGFSTEEESAGGRILAWSDGLNMLRSRPLFGVGYGNFTEYHELTAHNSFVLCFAELGLLGYFMWLALNVTAFRDVNRVAESTEGSVDAELVSYCGMLRASLIGFLTCAWFLSRTYAPPLFILLALCGVAWGCAQKQEEPEAQPVPPSKFVLTTASALIASIVAVYAIVIVKHAG